MDILIATGPRAVGSEAAPNSLDPWLGRPLFPRVASPVSQPVSAVLGQPPPSVSTLTPPHPLLVPLRGGRVCVCVLGGVGVGGVPFHDRG